MKQKFVILLITSLIITSCTKDFLDKNPSNSATNEEALGSIQGIKSAIQGCYNDMQSPFYYGRNFILINEVYSDNAKLSNNNVGSFSSFYNFSVTSNDEDITNLWSTGYRIITNTNNILDALENNTNISTQEKNSLKGEALAIRSFVYFDLVRFFAQNYSIPAISGISNANGKGGHLGIPLVLQALPKDTLIQPARNTVKEVYDQIISDLIQSDTLLTDKEIKPFTFNSYSVKALLSIVYLTTKEYEKAIYYANEVIQSSEYEIETNDNYISSWTKEFSTETIFSIAMTATDNNGTNSIGHMLSPKGYGGVIPSNDLSKLYSSNDIRSSFLLKENETYFNKYSGRNESLGLDNIPILRLSEMYFVLAESYAAKGKNYYAVSREKLSVIVMRNDKTAIQGSEIGDALLKKIELEYQKEFAFEGKRLFQIKRIAKNIERNDCNSSICKIEYPNKKFTFPIPLSETNVNKNIIQNPGY